MYIKIYFTGKPLYLCDEIDSEIQPYIHHDDTIFIDELNLHTVKSMIHEMENEKIQAGVFYHPELEELKKSFFKKFRLVQAGGGLVVNKKNEVLFIFRKGKWDLPKGKLDKGEFIEDCSIREVKEETGIDQVVIDHLLLKTYHTYHEGSRYILKESIWYLMKTESENRLTPQVDEQITDARWMNEGEMEKIIPDTYPSIADVISFYLKKTAH